MWRSISLFGLLLVGTGHAVEPMNEDNQHIRSWNAFAENVYQLHQKLSQVDGVTIRTRFGGYAGMPEFYREEQYYLGDRLISKVQWEKAQDKVMHSIEVFIYDDQGRVIRDYTAAYLPTYRNAPTQTLISLHRYHDQLHAFRTFDASGYRILERCTGRLEGREVNLLLDEDEIAEALGVPGSIMDSDEYRACFGDLQAEAGMYLLPQ
jgi:hypothetical protein